MMIVLARVEKEDDWNQSVIAESTPSTDQTIVTTSTTHQKLPKNQTRLAADDDTIDSDFYTSNDR